MELTLDEKKLLGDKNPDIQWALDILKPPYEDRLIWDRFSMYDLLGFIAGTLYWPLHNTLSYRPFHARPLPFLTLGLISMTACNIVKMFKQLSVLNESAVCRKYIVLHPEYFPLQGRKKYADLYLPWAPKR